MNEPVQGATLAQTWTPPTRGAAAWLAFRVAVHVARRSLRDMLPGQRVKQHGAGEALRDAPVLAEVRSPLWTDGRTEEFALVAGKVHNLRVACRAFDGLVVPPGEVLSFWRQLGRPSAGNGFVIGRELRSGCVVPTIAGGLCQLSNAMATAAVRAGAELTERHGHTARIEQAMAAAGDAVDATVLWNYIDLRWRAPFAVRIEAELTSDELVVRLRGEGVRRRSSLPIIDSRAGARADPQHLARGCMTCNETSCFRHGRAGELPAAGRRAVLVNLWTPEWASHLGAMAGEADWHLPWLRAARRHAGWWQPPEAARVRVAWLPSLRRMWDLRSAKGEGGSRQAALQRADERLAASAGHWLRPEHTDIVVDQSLLVPLWRAGHLGGRRFEVLVSALPAQELQQRLDAASRHWPQASSLVDYRVDTLQASAELAALRAAAQVWTPHHEVARYLSALGLRKVGLLPWQRQGLVYTASAPSSCPDAPLVVFPASALPRKGAHEMAAAMRELGWRVRILGSASSDQKLWQGVVAEHGRYADPGWLGEADVVALPAHVEHSPRALLKALAAGVPVVATPACGLPPDSGAFEVPAGDVQALVRALQHARGTRAPGGRPASIADACGEP